MIARAFYRFGEAVERLGVDRETIRQALAFGKISPFLEFAGSPATWACGNRDELRKEDPYARWFVPIISSGVEFDDEGELTLAQRDKLPCTINGWFRVSEQYCWRAAQSGFFASRLYVAPSIVDPEFVPWNLWFVVKLPDDNVPLPEMIGASEIALEAAWFLASEIDAIAAGKTLVATKWPWGDHETQALRDVAAAAKQWWSTYDPDNPATAPTNDEVADWLVKERRVSRGRAEAIASVLRADDLKDGRRPK